MDRKSGAKAATKGSSDPAVDTEPESLDAALATDEGAVTLLEAFKTEDLPPRVQLTLTQMAVEAQGLRRALLDARMRITKLEALAELDPLTPTLNRRAFLHEVEDCQAWLRRHGGEASLLHIDIDHMKVFNDRFGHAAGDRALKLVAESLQRAMGQGDVIGRTGGDEFTLLLSDSDDLAAAIRARRLGHAFSAKPVQLGTPGRSVSCSFGVQPLSLQETPEAALAAADLALTSR